MYIHFPAAFKRSELVHGPLLMPTNKAQQKTYDSVVKNMEFASRFTDSIIPYYLAAYVRHNLLCAGLRFLPVSIIGSPADLLEPYSKWRGYEYLIRCDSENYYLLPQHSPLVYTEAHYMDALQALRRLKVDAINPSDILVLDDATAVCINQIDKLRMRQRRRREVRA